MAYAVPQRLIRGADVDAVRTAIDEAAFRWQVEVHEVAILSDHVHLVRGNVFKWARGYFVESLSRTHVRAACAYVARQHVRHPDRVPQ